jgi:hypothetical protein
MEQGLSREELIEIIAAIMDEEGFEIYEPESEEKYLPDFLAVYTDESGEKQQIAVQVEDCQTLQTEEAEKRAKAIAEHCRRSGEGYLLVIPIECEDLGNQKFDEWGLSDVAELIPIGIEFEEEEEEL